ncbi:MAG: hypothetical protein ACYDBT_04895 [Desulfobulbaceae bacterium]
MTNYDPLVVVVGTGSFNTLDPEHLRSYREQAVFSDVKHALQEGVADAGL